MIRDVTDEHYLSKLHDARHDSNVRLGRMSRQLMDLALACDRIGLKQLAEEHERLAEEINYVRKIVSEAVRETGAGMARDAERHTHQLLAGVALAMNRMGVSSE